jgi:CheY-like chemotaxis protein
VETRRSSQRVLVIEDEWLVATLLEDMLAELGHSVVATAGTVDDALAAVDGQRFDLALIDMNLHGKSARGVADRLSERGIPFACTTGYGRTDLDERFRGRPILLKPFELRDLEAIIAQALPATGG